MSVRDRSGSCAVILLVTPQKVYCANIGDSRAILSRGFGQEKVSISLDHKPSELSEKNRIIKAGGKVYQSNAGMAANGLRPVGPPILGPMRVLPGRLSVSKELIGLFESILTCDLYRCLVHLVTAWPRWRSMEAMQSASSQSLKFFKCQ